MKVFRLLVVFVLGLLVILPVAAQGPGECPANVLLALGRAGATCSRTERDQACYGNGMVEATFQPGVSDVSFGMPGDIVDVAALRQLRVGALDDEEAEFSVVTLQLQADLVGTEQRSVTVLLFGDVEIENLVPSAPELTVTATGTLNIRTSPDPDGEIAERLNIRDTVVANGRTGDGGWLRVVVPNTNALGWISTEVISVEGNVATLNVVEATTPFYRPFQVFTLRTGVDDAWCDEAPHSGALVQTPNTFTPVELIANGVTLRVAATVYLQAVAGGMLTVNVLDGSVEVEAFGTARFVPAGARVQLPLGEDLMATDAPVPPEPYVMAELQALPVNNLAVRIRVPLPLTQEEIETLVAEYFAPTPTPLPISTPSGPERCVRTVQRAESLRSGPGMFYAVVSEIERGSHVTPVYRVTDADGVVWWQLRNGHWIPANAVESTGECPEVPVTDQVQPPAYNNLSLETCETSNGPIRAGQQVTMDFVPPGWDTLEEAREAVRVDPGRITVDDQRLQVQASNPIQIAEERYIRTFTATWTATSGSHRIVGERLTYRLICNVTVPPGP